MGRNKDAPTAYEIAALRAIVAHGTVQAAANSLFVSSHTVDWHLDNLRRKTGLRYLPQLVAWAAQQGLLLGVPGYSSPDVQVGSNRK